MGPAGIAVETISDGEEIPGGDIIAGWASHLFEDCNDVADGLVDSAAIQDFMASLMDEKRSACDALAVAAPATAGGGGDDDDDCIMLDGDPNKALVVAEEKTAGEDGQEDELRVVAEKGELACRDFPHPRHLCATFPFSTSPHANHCAMCHCYVCDSPAPCNSWGNGTKCTDHCHATDDKDAQWKKLREKLKCKTLPASNRGSIPNFFGSSSTAQAAVPQSIPPRPTVTQRLVRRVPAVSNVIEHQQMHQSIGVGQNVGQAVPQSFPPRPTVTQPLAKKVPAASNVIGSQQMRQSTGVGQNVGQAVRVRIKSSPRPKVTHKNFKRAAATPVYTSSNANNLHPAVPNYAPVQSARSTPSSNIIPGTLHGCTLQGYPPRHSHSALIGYKGLQVQPTSYPQIAPGMAADPGVRPFHYSTHITQGRQCPQDPSPGQQKELQYALTKLAFELEVSDYNINRTNGQQSASTQPMHQQLLAQAKASRRVEPNNTFFSSTTNEPPQWP